MVSSFLHTVKNNRDRITFLRYRLCAARVLQSLTSSRNSELIGTRRSSAPYLLSINPMGAKRGLYRALVKLSLSLIKRHALGTYGGNGSIAVTFLTSALDGD